MGAIRVLSDENRKDLCAFFTAQEDVVAAFLFGSVARNEERSDSDIDLAVLFDYSMTIAPLRPAELASEVMSLLRRNDVDLVRLNGATPLLKHRVARDGEVLYARSNRDVAMFVMQALAEYIDTKPLRELRQKKLKQRIKDGLGERT